jgi:hypothetical protein
MTKYGESGLTRLLKLFKYYQLVKDAMFEIRVRHMMYDPYEELLKTARELAQLRDNK